MKRFKGFGARRSFEIPNPSHSVQFPSVKKISQVAGVDSKAASPLFSPASTDSQVPNSSVMDHRRRVEKKERDEIVDSLELQPVSKDWKSPLRGIAARSPTGNSFSSATDSQSGSSSRPSNASAYSNSSASETILKHETGNSEAPQGRAIVVGFDANARDALVGAIAWAFRHALKKGDVVILVGVMDFIRGPLGYKVQANDQTWLGANKKLLNDEIKLKNLTWGALPGLKKSCETRGVKLVVNVMAAARPEVVIVQEAVALGAVMVVLDKSLNNRRRGYYFERLDCDVMRMRRSGGVDAIRLRAPLPSPPSPTSVIPTRSHVFPRQPDEECVKLPEGSSSNSSVSRRVALVEGNNTASFTSSGGDSNLNVHVEDELFTIDHVLMRHAMSLEAENRHHGARPSVDNGYESDDLFSLYGGGGGDGTSRRSSFAIFLTPADTSQPARDSFHQKHDPAMASFIPPRSSLDSGPPLDKRILSHPTGIAKSPKNSPFVAATVTEMRSLDGLLDMVKLHLCDVLFPGESLLVGASPSALFMINSQFSTAEDSGLLIPFCMFAGPPTAFVAVDGSLATKLKDLKSGQCIVVVDSSGRKRNVPVGYTTTQAIKPLVQVEAVASAGEERHSLVIHHAQSVCLLNPSAMSDVSVRDLKVGDGVMMCS